MKKLAITMGDPGGVGPEIVMKAVTSPRVRDRVIPIVIGVEKVFTEAAKIAGVKVDLISPFDPERVELASDKVFFIPIDGPNKFQRGKATKEGGDASVECIRKAVQLCLEKKFDGVVTAPISKKAISLAGYAWPGHTEMIAELTGARKVAMMFVGEKLKVILATIHMSLSAVPGMITKERVHDTIHMALRACKMLNVSDPRIGVAGLNPHAGEEGLFGDEEVKEIVPAIEQATSEGINAMGPFPPDVIFKNALEDKFDIVVAMYHDQGLIPFKMLYFDTGVNATIGLPIIRTSPDHGTAYDIAWKGSASPASMIEAILVAEQMKL